MKLPSCITKVEPQKPAAESIAGPVDSQLRSSEKSVNPNPIVDKPIDDARLCKICYNDELRVVFLPCGHMVTCVKCAPGMTSCALCRQPISMTVRAFFS